MCEMASNEGIGGDWIKRLTTTSEDVGSEEWTMSCYSVCYLSILDEIEFPNCRQDHKSSVLAVEWNKNGHWLLTASRDHLIKL